MTRPTHRSFLSNDRSVLFRTDRRCDAPGLARASSVNESCLLSCTVPGCKWCTNEVMGLEELTAQQQARCGDCECRGCYMCRRMLSDSSHRHAVGAFGCSASTPLVILIRGQAFRYGLRSSRNSSDTPDIRVRQVAALSSLRKYVINPAVHNGWSVELVIDVDAPPTASSLVKDRCTSILWPYVSAVRVKALLATQMQTLLANLEFALHSTRASPAHWRALLLVRIDLRWKREVVLPPPGQVTYQMISPWRVDTNLTTGGAWLNDVFLFVPACRVSELWTALARRVALPTETGRSLHFLCFHTACGVRFLEPCQFAANSYAERNPLYAMIGRPEAKWMPPWPQCIPRRRFDQTAPLWGANRLAARVRERCTKATHPQSCVSAQL